LHSFDAQPLCQVPHLCALQEFEKKAGDALMRGYSIPAATHAVLEAATRANTTARANSTNSNGSGGNDEQVLMARPHMPKVN